jgi:hypothetical protein
MLFSGSAQENPVKINSSDSVDIIVTNISLENNLAVRKIEIYDRYRKEVFETFTHEVVSDNNDQSLAEQLNSGHFTGWIYLKQNDEILFAYRINDGQEDRENSTF